MDLMETMERTLHTAALTGPLKMAPPCPRKMRWPKEFKAPIDAAIHLDSSKPLRPSRFKGVVPAPLPFID